MPTNPVKTYIYWQQQRLIVILQKKVTTGHTYITMCKTRFLVIRSDLSVWNAKVRCYSTGNAIVIVISRFLKRYLKVKRTRAPAYSRALRRIKGVSKGGSREVQVQFPEYQEGTE